MTPDDEILAAELAAGLLEGDERSAAEQRRATDVQFAQAVARWEDRSAAILAAADEPPRPSLWAQIEARLPANDAGWHDRLRVSSWKIATFTASAAAILLGFVAVDRKAPPPAPIVTAPAAMAPLVAMLTGTDGKAVVAVSFDPAQRRLTISPAALQPGRHSAELWVIPADKHPRSLGIIDAAGNWRRAPAGTSAMISPGATLAVSIEPLGGSRTGQPTGPVVVSGIVHEI